MNLDEPPQEPDELTAAIEAWKHKHKLTADDPALWLLELFEIHRTRWENLFQPDVSLDPDDRDQITHMAGQLRTLAPELTEFSAQLHRLKGGSAWIPPAKLAIVLAVGFALGTGILIGRFIL